MAKRCLTIHTLYVMVRTKRKNIAIHACPANRNADERRWAVGHWASLINQLDADIAFVGVWNDRPYYNRIWEHIEDTSRIYDLCGVKELVGTVIELCNMDLLVCVNSSIMHLGVEYKVPTVAIVGGTPAFIILPPESNKLRILEDPELKWWDSSDGHDVHINSRLNEIMPEDVLRKIDELG